MKTFIITIVYLNKAVRTLRIDANSESQAEHVAFDLADKFMGLTTENEKAQVELFFHNNPRHKVLFQGLTHSPVSQTIRLH